MTMPNQRYQQMEPKQLIKMIHIAKSKLGMEDEDYRTLLFTTTKKTSCTEMSRFQLQQVYDAMKQKGFKVKRNKKSPKSKGQPIDKLRAIWIDMAKAGFIKDGSEAALCAWVKKQTTQLNGGLGIETLEWLQQDSALTSKVLERLKQWQKRMLRPYKAGQHE